MLRRSLLALLVSGCDMAGLGIGSANPGAIPAGLPLGSATWAAGYWFDLISQVGAQGAPITSSIASLAGSKTLTPVSSPLIETTAIGGQRGCLVDNGSGMPHFNCDAVAPVLAAGGGQKWFLGTDWEQGAVMQTPLWYAGSSTGGVTDQISGQTIVEHIALQWTVGGVTTTITGTIPLAYDYHRLFWDYDGTTLRMYVDGVLDVATVVALPALNVNVFTLLAYRSSVTFGGSTGRARRFLFTPSSVFDVSGIATVDAYLAAQDYTLPLLSSPKILFGGDSISAGYGGSLNTAGIRAYLLNKIQSERLSLQAIGQFIQGTIQNRPSAAQGGAAIATIRTFLMNALNADTGLGPYLILGMCGTNDLVGGNPVTMAGLTRTLLDDVYTLAASKNAAVKIAWSTLTDVNPAASGASNVAPYNVELTKAGGVFDSCLAGVAGKLVRFDNNAYLGPWGTGTNYVDNSHPNVAGDNLIGVGQWPVIEPVFRSISPT